MLFHIFLHNLVLKMLASVEKESLWPGEPIENIIQSLNDIWSIGGSAGVCHRISTEIIHDVQNVFQASQSSLLHWADEIHGEQLKGTVSDNWSEKLTSLSWGVVGTRKASSNVHSTSVDCKGQ